MEKRSGGKEITSLPENVCQLVSRYQDPRSIVRCLHPFRFWRAVPKPKKGNSRSLLFCTRLPGFGGGGSFVIRVRYLIT